MTSKGETNMTKLMEMNETKAYRHVAKALGVELEVVVQEGEFFTDLREIFKWVYLDEVDSVSDLVQLVHQLSNVSIDQLLTAKVETPAEYLAWVWENTHSTPYGYVKYHV